MEPKNFYNLSEGEISVSLEQEAIHIKAIDKFGDPVELTKKKALELSNILKQLAENISE
jgi:hypothetical protein